LNQNTREDTGAAKGGKGNLINENFKKPAFHCRFTKLYNVNDLFKRLDQITWTVQDPKYFKSLSDTG
jgi:hypothetical protein